MPYKAMIFGSSVKFGDQLPLIKTRRTKSGWLHFSFWAKGVFSFKHVAFFSVSPCGGLVPKKELVHHAGWGEWKVSCQRLICDIVRQPFFNLYPQIWNLYPELRPLTTLVK